jgi:hypothetical protein
MGHLDAAGESRSQSDNLDRSPPVGKRAAPVRTPMPPPADGRRLRRIGRREAG